MLKGINQTFNNFSQIYSFILVECPAYDGWFITDIRKCNLSQASSSNACIKNRWTVVNTNIGQNKHQLHSPN